MIGYIYITENIINKKVYIGKHYKSYHDITYYGSGILLQKAIIKYGIHNFTNKIILFCKTEEELNRNEIFYINEYSKTHSLYNLAKGGTGGYTIKYHSNKKDIIEKQRQGNLLRYSKMTKEQKNDLAIAISNSKKGKRPNMNGYVHSDETKRKISAGLKNSTYYGSDAHKLAIKKTAAAKKGIPNYKSRKVIIINDIKYESVQSAANTLNISKRTLYNWMQAKKVNFKYE